jgi:hypothetical protein
MPQSPEIISCQTRAAGGLRYRRDWHTAEPWLQHRTTHRSLSRIFPAVQAEDSFGKATLGAGRLRYEAPILRLSRHSPFAGLCPTLWTRRFLDAVLHRRAVSHKR